MASKLIEIIIPADGSPINIDLKGYEGNGCSKDANELLKELEAVPKKRTKKREYFKIKKNNSLREKI